MVQQLGFHCLEAWCLEIERCVGVGLLLGRIEGIRGMRADLIYKSVWRERKSTWFLYLYIAGGLRIGVGY